MSARPLTLPHSTAQGALRYLAVLEPVMRALTVLVLMAFAASASAVDATQLTSDAQTTFSALKVIGGIAVGLVCLAIIGVTGWKMKEGGQWAAGVTGLIALIFVIGAYAIVVQVFG